MGESQHQNHQQQPQQPSRLGLRTPVSGGGEIVEVQGGHIVRSTGRKDRHSKVCTAKGPRDRRVRLSAHTAIQFYDVQDRLGYDRPSKAVDWLIKKAKSAIDELAVLPAWNPSTIIANLAQEHENRQEEDENQGEIHGGVGETLVEERGFGYDDNSHNTQNPNSNSGFLPASLDSDSIADTIRSFFPVGAQAETSNSSMQFQNYPPDLLSRSSSNHNQNQDLRLSLHSFADPILMHHHHAAPSQHQPEQALFGGFDTSSGGWGDHHHASEINRFQRMVAWNGSGGGGGGGGFVFNSPPQPQPHPPLQPLFGENPLFSQRGPLQSINTHSIRAWIDPAMDHEQHHHHDHHQHHQVPSIHQSSISGIRFASGGFSGFRIPARIQGEEEHDGISNKPSSASSDSRH